MSLTNFNFLEREAALFRDARGNIETAVNYIQTKVEENTKEERAAVEKAMTALNTQLAI